MPRMIELKSIYKSFGKQQVLNGLNLLLEPGKIYSLVGGNGAGKTTLFNVITGFMKLDKGEIKLKDIRIDRLSPITINKMGVTRTFQDLRIITKLSVKENILLSFKGNPGENIFNSILPSGLFKKKYMELNERADIILHKIHLKSVENSLAGDISYGQQKLLTFGCCFANDAQLLLLDEPVAGIDNDNYNRIVNLVMGIKAEGRTVFQIEHNREYINQVSDHIFHLHDGILLSSNN